MRISKDWLTQAKLKEFLHYDLNTGAFTWVKSFRKGWVGKAAGTKKEDAYIHIQFGGRMYLAHRLAWLYVYGELPDELDHKDEVKHHNWIENLREADHSRNLMNVKTKSNNTSGVKSVFWHAGKSQWYGLIVSNKVRYRLGYFDNIEDAAKAVRAKRAELHAEFANHG